MKAVLTFLMAIPELIKLVNSVIEHHKKLALDKKVNDDIRKITEAFRDLDSDKLVSVFNDTGTGTEKVQSKEV